MTLETAKQIVEDSTLTRNKEAEAVVRGGMTYCEQKDNGERVYLWLKVHPTKTDEESSIKEAIQNYQNRKNKRTTIKENELLTQDPVKTNQEATEIETPTTDSPITLSQLLKKIKRRMWDLWQQIDAIVIE